jgi:hypothetical protein
MLRGEREFLLGMLLLFVGPVIGSCVGSLFNPVAVALCIIGILLILGAALNTG